METSLLVNYNQQQMSRHQKHIIEKETQTTEINNDILVLRVCYNDFEDIETECFVFYDNLEKEYFICGSREQQKHSYKFFCKKRENVINFIESIVDNKPVVTNPGVVNKNLVIIELLNYPNLFKNNDQVDFHLFANEEAEWSIISCRESQTYTASLQNELSRCLKSLKMVRW